MSVPRHGHARQPLRARMFSLTESLNGVQTTSRWSCMGQNFTLTPDSRAVMIPGNWSPPDSPQGPGGVIFFRAIPAEPDIKRAVSFIDGQNLYRHAKDAFGHHHPSYDPRRLVDAVCADRDWVNHGVRFYTGFPSADRTPMWHGYWARRLTAMRRSGIAVTSRPLRYRAEGFDCPTSRPRASRRTREGHRPAARARHRTYGAQRGARRGGRVQSEPESHGAPDAGKAATCYPAHLAAGKLAESGQEVNISAAVPHICSKASQRSSRLRVRSVTSSSLHALTSLSS